MTTFGLQRHIVILTVMILLTSSVSTAQVLVWRRAVAGTMTITGVAAAPGDGVYATGATNAGEQLLLRLDADGNELWRRTVDVRLSGVAAALDGVVVVGTTPGTSPSDANVWVRKYTVSGDVAWDRQFGGANLDRGDDVAVGPNDEVVIVGFFDGVPPLGTGSVLLARKYDSQANELWTMQLDHQASVPAAASVTVSGGGTSYVAGADSLFAIDPNGQQTWSRAAANLIDVAAGGSGISATSWAFLRRYDTAGAEVWSAGASSGLAAVAADHANRTFAVRSNVSFFCPVFGPFLPFPFFSINLLCSITVFGHLAAYDEAGMLRWSASEGGWLNDVTAGDGFLFVGGSGGGGSISKYVANLVHGDIDVVPGSLDNVLKTSRRGVVPVAILTTDVFDATTIRPDTACFGGRQPSACGETHGRNHVEDVDHDGDLDVVLHFEMAASGLQPGDTLACVTAKTTDGSVFAGCDAIAMTR